MHGHGARIISRTRSGRERHNDPVQCVGYVLDLYFPYPTSLATGSLIT